MKIFFCSLICFVATACATPSVRPDAAARRHPESKPGAVEQLYTPFCPAPARFSPDHCGLLVQSIVAGDGQRALSSSCGSHNDLACQKVVIQQLLPQWQTRYPKADPAAIQAWCQESPLECQNAALLELQWMDSHNAGVLKEFGLSRMDAKLHTKRYYARVRREQREAGLLASAVEVAETAEADSDDAQAPDATVAATVGATVAATPTAAGTLATAAPTAQGK